MAPRRIELRTARCKRAVLPLDYEAFSFTTASTRARVNENTFLHHSPQRVLEQEWMKMYLYVHKAFFRFLKLLKTF